MINISVTKHIGTFTDAVKEMDDIICSNGYDFYGICIDLYRDVQDSIQDILIPI